MSESKGSVQGITPEATQIIYDEMLAMEVKLDENPLIYGPKRLNEKMAKARNYLTRVQEFYLQVHRVAHTLKAAQRASESVLEVQVMHLIATDPMVRAGSSQKVKEALAYHKLRDEMDEKVALDLAVLDVNMVLEAIKMKKRDLAATITGIRDQIKLCQTEVSLNARWGSQKPPEEIDTEPKPDLIASAMAVDSVDDLLDDLGVDVSVPARDDLVGPEEEEVVSEPEPAAAPEPDPDPDPEPVVAATPEPEPAPTTTVVEEVQDPEVAFAGTASEAEIDSFLDIDFTEIVAKEVDDDEDVDFDMLFDADGGGDALDESLLS